VKPLTEQNFYEILEVRTDAPAPEIETAYTRARELYGPGSLATYSLVAPEEAALLAARIEEARRILLDPDARARYDAGLAAAAEATETAVRIAATGSGAVAAGPQRPWVAPALTPRPPPPAIEPPRTPEPEPAKAVEPFAEKAQPEVAAPPTSEPAPEPQPPAAPPVAAPATPSAAPILLQKEVAEPAREFPVPDGAVWSGEALRRVRESRGLSVREVCERTKVSRYHLENIEGERFTLLPAPVYLRGILQAVARELRLDGQKVARSYLERMAGQGGDPSKAR
jgi:hypothetical protein